MDLQTIRQNAIRQVLANEGGRFYGYLQPGGAIKWTRAGFGTGAISGVDIGRLNQRLTIVEAFERNKARMAEQDTWVTPGAQPFAGADYTAPSGRIAADMSEDARAERMQQYASAGPDPSGWGTLPTVPLGQMDIMARGVQRIGAFAGDAAHGVANAAVFLGSGGQAVPLRGGGFMAKSRYQAERRDNAFARDFGDEANANRKAGAEVMERLGRGTRGQQLRLAGGALGGGLGGIAAGAGIGSMFGPLGMMAGAGIGGMLGLGGGVGGSDALAWARGRATAAREHIPSDLGAQAGLAGQSLGGGFGGMAAGAGLGSLLGPVGMMAGAVVGGLGGMAGAPAAVAAWRQRRTARTAARMPVAAPDVVAASGDPEDPRKHRPPGSRQCKACGHFTLAADVPAGVCTSCGAENPEWAGGGASVGAGAGGGRGGGGGGGGARRGGGIGQGIMSSAMGGMARGAAYGAIGAGITGAAIGSIAAPLQQAIALALSPLGGSGAGIARIGNAAIQLVATGLSTVAQAGAGIIGGALGLVFGAALGGILGVIAPALVGLVASIAGVIGGLMGSVMGAMGGVLGQIGKALGETLGGIVEVFTDATRSALAYADAIMRIATLSGQTAQASANWMATLRAMGMEQGEAASFITSMGNRNELLGMRLSAFGVDVARKQDGSMDPARTMAAAGQTIGQYPQILQRQAAGAMFGPGAENMLPVMLDPERMREVIRAQDEMAPRAEAIQRAWAGLKVPLQELGLLWDGLKVQFVSSFVPLIRRGVETISILWRDHGAQVIGFLLSLPDLAVKAYDVISGKLKEWANEYLPKVLEMWRNIAEVINKVSEWLTGKGIIPPGLMPGKQGGSGGGRRRGGRGFHNAAYGGDGDEEGEEGGGYSGGGGSGVGGDGGFLGRARDMAESPTGKAVAKGAEWSVGHPVAAVVGAVGLAAAASMGGRALLKAAPGLLMTGARGLGAGVSGIPGAAGLAGSAIPAIGGGLLMADGIRRGYQNGPSWGGAAEAVAGGALAGTVLGGLGVPTLIGGAIGLVGYGVGLLAGRNYREKKALEAKYAESRRQAAEAAEAAEAGGDGSDTGQSQSRGGVGEWMSGALDSWKRAWDEAGREQTERPVKVDVQTNVSVDVKPSKEFEVGITRNEVLSSYRAIQASLGG